MLDWRRKYELRILLSTRARKGEMITQLYYLHGLWALPLRRAWCKRGSTTILFESKVDEYPFTLGDTRKLDWVHSYAKLNLSYGPLTVKKRLNRRSYF